MADLNIGNSTANVLVNAKHNGSVTPQINNTYDLGTSALRWKNIYGDLKGNASTATTATNLASAGTWTWTGGTTVGPTASLVLGGKTTSVGAIPSASTSASGIITTGAQSFGGDKTFNGNVNLTASHGIIFTSTAGGTNTSTPTGLTYGRLQGYGSFSINANTDGSEHEYLILTSGRGMSDSKSDGLAIGYDSITWRDNNLWGKYLMKKTTIDASSLDQNTWYPVSIYVPPNYNVRIEVEVALDSGTTPSWSTHSSGFSVRKIWETNGSGWGTIPVTRNIYVSTYSFASVDPVRGLDQNTMASVEIVYVRGGGKYFFRTSPEAGTPTLNPSGYSWSGGGNYSYSAPITTTAPAPIYAYADITVPRANTATKLATARTISLTGSVTGSGTFDGSGNLSISTTTNHSHNSLSYKPILDNESAINSFHAANTFQAAIWSGTSSPGVSNGIILDMGYTSTTYGAQIAIDDDPTYFMALRQRGSDGWNAWKRIPMGDGTGASGTWGISVTGSSASCTGNASSATKLATARTIRTNLASTSAASFDGSANITPGVTGTLPIANGGTGATNASAARNNLGAQSKVLYGTSAPSNSTGSNGDMYIALDSGDFKKDIVNLIYPVGSIYISMNSTNPSTLFGGTWQAFGQGRTLIGVGTGNDGTTSMSFTSGGKTGGTYKNTHNHYTLYSNDGASFFMSMSSNAPRSRVVTKDRASWTLSNSSNVTREDSTYNETIDIVQPYITVYFWRRTA